MRDYVVKEKDSQVLGSEKSQPYQTADFVVVTAKDQPNAPMSYLPLTSKLNLQKSKKKRAGLTSQELKRNFYVDDATGQARPMKITGAIPDKYLIAARGYTEDEAREYNASLKSLQCESEVAREGINFTDKKVVKQVEKNESKYIKPLFKKSSATSKPAVEEELF